MLKKIFRLRGEDLKDFFREKRNVLRSKNFLIFYKKNQLKHPRFSIKFETKIFKKAVQRNRLKRRLYEIIRKNWGKFVKKNYDIVIFPLKNELVEEKFKILEKNLLELIDKINV